MPYIAKRDIKQGTALAFAAGDVIPDDNYRNLGLTKDDAEPVKAEPAVKE